MAAAEKFLIVSRGNVGDRKQTAFTHEASARKRFADDKADGRAVWLYGQSVITPDNPHGLRPLLDQTPRTPKENP